MERPTSGVPASRDLSPALIRWLAGLDTAVVAALAGGSWFCFATWLRGEYWWAPLNVAGALFYGDRAFHLGLGRATLAGAALLLVLHTLLGTLITRAVPSPARIVPALLIGLAGGVLCQLAAERWFWSQLHPFAPAYFPRTSTLPAHLLFGVSLARIGARRRALLSAFGPPPFPPPLGEDASVQFLLPSAPDETGLAGEDAVSDPSAESGPSPPDPPGQIPPAGDC
jgi:hypothetical protein